MIIRATVVEIDRINEAPASLLGRIQNFGKSIDLALQLAPILASAWSYSSVTGC